MTLELPNPEWTEQQMREAEVPAIESATDLAAYIDALATREHDYGTCVYAMSMAATAAFRYMARHLGVTDFQASCADLNVLRRTRHIDGPLMFIRGEDALYPQYDLPARTAEFVAEIKPWLAEQAQKKLDALGKPGIGEPEGVAAHPDVVAHWKRLAAGDAL